MADIRKAVHDETREDGGEDIQVALTRLRDNPLPPNMSVDQIARQMEEGKEFIIDTKTGSVCQLVQSTHEGNALLEDITVVWWMWRADPDDGPDEMVAKLAPVLLGAIDNFIASTPRAINWTIGGEIPGADAEDSRRRGRAVKAMFGDIVTLRVSDANALFYTRLDSTVKEIRNALVRMIDG